MCTWNHYKCTLYLKFLGLRMYKIQRRSANQQAEKWTFRTKRAPALSSYIRVSRHSPLQIITQITWNQLTWHTAECWISKHQSFAPPPLKKKLPYTFQLVVTTMKYQKEKFKIILNNTFSQVCITCFYHVIICLFLFLYRCVDLWLKLCKTIRKVQNKFSKHYCFNIFLL
jgi:hypothetical protein